MPTANAYYELIKNKIDALKTAYPSLRAKTDDFVFSALCIKSNLFKNPALILNEQDFDDMIVDGQYDGGVDVLLTDPSSDFSDLIIGQSKFYTSINSEDVMNALTKMALFYKDMLQGRYEQVNATVQRRFLTLFSELGEDAKIHFVFYTSAAQSGINRSRIEKRFREQFTDSSNIEVSFYFGKDIEEEIKESESRRATVETGKIRIDETGNYLLYGDDAAVVNVSAFSIKALYAQHNITLLARNLRYHIAGRDIDKGIEDTIQNSPESFWLKNNGITIVCDDFRIDGREVKLSNFSIINGGQTTYMLHKSRFIDEHHDLFLPCKIIKTAGETEDEKNAFSLAIAKATNTQKPIKPVDLKANSPEQVRFAQSMRDVGIFYQTKRGETVPRQFREAYLNTSLLEVGKLCLAGIFQMPCASRNKPSSLYQPQYYEKIFGGSQVQIARLCKELLYIDYYFRAAFQKKFDRENSAMPDSSERIAFAHNARTLCIAFVAFAARVNQQNIGAQDIQAIFNASRNDNSADALYDIFSDIEGVDYFLPPALFASKDAYEAVLDKLFNTIINVGIVSFSMASTYDSTLTATNYLKKDKNYYTILRTHWATIHNDIQRIFADIHI